MMNIEYSDCKLPDPDSFLDLYQSTGWDKEGEKKKTQLCDSLTKSWYYISAFHEEKLVGFGRIISDGYLHSFITELIISPQYKGKGIGKQILEKLVHKSIKEGITDIQLFSAKGKMEFYIKSGFIKRPDEAQGMQYNL